MLQTNHRQMRVVALLTGGVLAATAVFQPAPARAADPDKEQLYKGGAAALGVLGAYFILKGKTLPGALAGAGAYYAYKKGQDVAKNDRYGGYYGDDYYRNDDYRNDDYYYRNDDYRNDRRSRRNDYRRDDYYRNDDYRNDDYRYNNLDPAVVLR